MKSTFMALLLLTTLSGYPQYQQAIDKCKTVIDLKNDRFLDGLLQTIGNKRIVALGEDTHGTAEFYELRAAITQRLIKEKGFNLVILENPHEDMMALQAGLQKEPLDTLMRRYLFSIYQTKQMQSFLQWFKQYNSEHTSLRLAGCDDSRFGFLYGELAKTAARYNNDNLNEMCKEFLSRQMLSIKEFYKQYPHLKPDTQPDQLQFGQGSYYLLQKIDSLCEAQRIQDPKLKELLFHAKTSFVYYDRFVKKDPISRDEVMGQRINYHAADPNAKVIVWAHSGHIAKYAWLYNELGLMGATVQKQFPDDYIAIGMSCGQGNYSYIKNRIINNDHYYTDSLFNNPLHPCKKGSWNELFRDNVKGNFYLDFSKLTPEQRSEFNKQRHLKILGYGLESNTAKDYYKVSLARLFDVLIFLQETNHTTALFN